MLSRVSTKQKHATDEKHGKTRVNFPQCFRNNVFSFTGALSQVTVGLDLAPDWLKKECCLLLVRARSTRFLTNHSHRAQQTQNQGNRQSQSS